MAEDEIIDSIINSMDMNFSKLQDTGKLDMLQSMGLQRNGQD